LSTPLDTDRIVLAKWWGAFRPVPALALLPAIGAGFIAAGQLELTFRFGPASQPPAPLGTVDRIALIALPMALFVAQGAAVTSLGLLLATWIKRLGRAVAASVSIYAFFAFVSVILGELVIELVAMFCNRMGTSPDVVEFVVMIIAGGCPLGGQLVPAMLVSLPASESRGAYYLGLVIVCLFTVLIALVMLALALLTFDRCLGRASNRPRRSRQIAMPHLLSMGSPEFHAKTQRKSETQTKPPEFHAKTQRKSETQRIPI
jgi:hypothetical protein